MNSNKTRTTLNNIILVGLFAALCYVALITFRIPIPSPVGKPFIHFGNMFVMLAALLFSGLVGGLAGSIGMGLFDVLNGYASSAYVTFILKFGIGITTGVVAAKGNKKDAKSPIKWIVALSVLFIAIGLGIIVLVLTKGNVISYPYKGKMKDFGISPLSYTFALILGVLLMLAAAVSRKMSIKMQYVILGATCGTIFNILGEFFFKVFTLTIAGSAFGPAVIASALNLPATVINGVFSSSIAVMLYIPLSKALSHAGLRFELNK